MSRPLAVKGAGASPSLFSTPGSKALRLKEQSSVAGAFAISSLVVVGSGRAAQAMNRDGPLPRRSPLPERDNLPPDDCGTGKDWRLEVESLYRDRADHLIGHFGSAVQDRDTARDIVHEAFAKFSALSVAKRLMVLRPDAYLYRMCVNLMRDRGRSQQTRTSHVEQEASIDLSHSPFAALEHRDTLRRLEAVMLRLSPKTREIFLAKRLDGMTYAEIAERTGLSVKGVEKHMSKAIAAVDRAIGRDHA